MMRTARSHTPSTGRSGARRTHGSPKRAAARRSASTPAANRRPSSKTPSRGTVTSKRAPTARQSSPKQPARKQPAPKQPASKQPAPKQPAPRRSRAKVNAPRPAVRTARRHASPQRRLKMALLVISLVLAAIIGRVAYLQTQEAASLRSAGADQWTRSYTLSAQRGTMFDRHGNELAMSVPAASISINPKLIVDGPQTIHDLANVLELDAETVADLLDEVARKDRGFVYVARQVDANVGEFIREFGHPGVNVDDVSRREMPGGDTGRSVIGRTNIDGVGIAGLEKQFDDVLTGTGGSMTREVDPLQRMIAGSETITQAPVSGDDLILTLDRSIQFATEQVLLEQLAKIGGRGATAIAMETATGEIYSMASVRRNDETGAYEVTSGNFAAVDSYEPGSVAKVITIAGALDAGSVEPDTLFNVPWRKKYYDLFLSDSHQHADETLSVSDILAVSSNIGTISVQERMGRFLHHEYMSAFGLGSKTALDFPGESAGILKAPEDLWGTERVTVAYGQGVASTSLQLVSAINTVANGGTYVDPKLVRATVGPDGTQTPMPDSGSRRVVSEQAAADTAAMMRRVVCEGTAKRAQVENLSIAGKTGTAFKAADNGTYWDDDGRRVYYASFVGFFPAEDPQVTVLVSVDEPPAGTGDRFGGTASAPVFAALVPTLVHELNIQPPPGSTGCAE